MKSKIVAVITALALTISLTACGGTFAGGNAGREDNYEGKTVITIGYLPITHALAVFEAKELLEKSNSDIAISLQKFSSWSDLTDALNADRIDGASVLIELAMSAKTNGIDLKAVALGHRDGNVIVASKDIQNVQDLKGKKIAIPHTQSSHNILVQEALEKSGLTIADVELIQLAPTEMPSSLASGSIDAYCVAEPFGAQAVSKGFGHTLYSSEELWEDSFCCGLVLNNASIERLGQATVKELVDKYYEAGASLNKEEAKHIATTYLGQEESVLETSLEWIRYDNLEITQHVYQSLFDKVKKFGINENPPEFDSFIYK